jgi:hypothetical protein
MGFVEEMLEADAPCAGDGSMEEQNTFFVRRGSVLREKRDADRSKTHGATSADHEEDRGGIV